MKKKEFNAIIKHIVDDKSITGNEIKVVLYSLTCEVFTIFDVNTQLDIKSQRAYGNQLCSGLVKKGYLKTHKMAHTKAIGYSFDKSVLDIAKGQMTIDDINQGA